MTFNFLNIPYKLPDPVELPSTRFQSIWKVEVDRNYRTYKSEGSDSPGIFLTYEGKGVYVDLKNQIEHHLEGNTVFIADKGIPCQYYCSEDTTWKFYYLEYSNLHMPSQLQLPIFTLFHTKAMEICLHLCGRMIYSLIQNQPEYGYMANLLFHKLLLSLSREIQERNTGDKSSELSKVLLWMHQNIDRPLKMNDLIAMSKMSRTLFFNSFKLLTGTSPTTYFNRLKLKSAELALQTTHKSVKTIAASLHFYDEYYFSKLFKREFGISPSAYRNLK